jgi:two-component system, chemotaxis family, protein-glutamate methylesterase/glutaminase
VSARDIIAVGTSAGGVAALARLLGGLPGKLNASVLIVQHTSPLSPKLLANILGRRTTLKVAYGQHGRPIERGHVYIAPADRHMTVVPPGVIRLNEGPKVRFSRPAIDPLFLTAAEIYGPRVIGVVLTGHGEDGTDGLWEIKAAGGVCVVQDPEEAIAREMPRSALARTQEAFKISLDEMATLLVRLVNGEPVTVLHQSSDDKCGRS